MELMELLYGAGMVAGGVGIALTGLMLGGIIWGIRRSAGWGKKNRQLPPSGYTRPKPQLEAPKEYRYLAEDGTAESKDVLKALDDFLADPVVGTYAQEATVAIQKSEVKRKGVFAAIEREFEAGTISWQKFAMPVDSALDAILRNCAAIANRIQRFETVEYQRLKRIADAGGIDSNAANAHQWEIMCDELEQIKALQGANDRLLVELDALSAELIKLAGSDLTEANDEILEELKQLTEDAKMYT